MTIRVMQEGEICAAHGREWVLFMHPPRDVFIVTLSSVGGWC